MGIGEMMQRLLALFLAPIGLVLTVAAVHRGAALSWTWSQTEPPPAVAAVEVAPPDWVAPSWLEGEDAAAIEAISHRGPRTGPRVRSASALVYDVDRGEVLYEKAADERWPVASLTKVVSAVTLGAVTDGAWGGELERQVCIGAEHYPTRSGARSKLHTGDCATGWDMLGAALTASDNRAAYALASVSGLGVDGFVGQMNAVADELGMDHSDWVEPSGIQDDNLSTARDMARATLALASMPALSPATAAPHWDLRRSNRAPRRLFTTNKLLGQRGLTFHVAKTGYTDTARYCFTAMVETSSGQRLVITLLRASGKQTRWADVRRILTWVEQS